MVESSSMSSGASERVVPRHCDAVVRGVSSGLSLVGLAGLILAATLGVVAAGGAPAPVTESGGSLEVASQDVAVSVAPQPLDRALPAETPPRPPAEPAVTSGGVGVSAEAHHGDDGTVIEASSTVPNTKARVTAGDDGERFVVTDEGEVEAGPWRSEWSGDTVSVSCNNVIGEVLCGSDDGSGED